MVTLSGHCCRAPSSDFYAHIFAHTHTHTRTVSGHLAAGGMFAAAVGRGADMDGGVVLQLVRTEEDAPPVIGSHHRKLGGEGEGSETSELSTKEQKKRDNLRLKKPIFIFLIWSRGILFFEDPPYINETLILAKMQ